MGLDGSEAVQVQHLKLVEGVSDIDGLELTKRRSHHFHLLLQRHQFLPYYAVKRNLLLN